MPPSLDPDPSEGADAAVDALAADIQRWVGDLGELRRGARRTARLARGTTAEPQALALLDALDAAPALPRALAFARTRAQALRDGHAARGAARQLRGLAGAEPRGLIDTGLD